MITVFRYLDIFIYIVYIYIYISNHQIRSNQIILQGIAEKSGSKHIKASFCKNSPQKATPPPRWPKYRGFKKTAVCHSKNLHRSAQSCWPHMASFLSRRMSYNTNRRWTLLIKPQTSLQQSVANQRTIAILVTVASPKISQFSIRSRLKKRLKSFETLGPILFHHQL